MLILRDIVIFYFIVFQVRVRVFIYYRCTSYHRPKVQSPFALPIRFKKVLIFTGHPVSYFFFNIFFKFVYVHLFFFLIVAGLLSAAGPRGGVLLLAVPPQSIRAPAGRHGPTRASLPAEDDSPCEQWSHQSVVVLVLRWSKTSDVNDR